MTLKTPSHYYNHHEMKHLFLRLQLNHGRHSCIRPVQTFRPVNSVNPNRSVEQSNRAPSYALGARIQFQSITSFSTRYRLNRVNIIGSPSRLDTNLDPLQRSAPFKLNLTIQFPRWDER